MMFRPWPSVLHPIFLSLSRTLTQSHGQKRNCSVKRDLALEEAACILIFNFHYYSISSWPKALLQNHRITQFPSGLIAPQVFSPPRTISQVYFVTGLFVIWDHGMHCYHTVLFHSKIPRSKNAHASSATKDYPPHSLIECFKATQVFTKR